MESTPNQSSDQPSDETRAAERGDARVEHVPDRAPTPDEEARADELELDDSVVAHEREMAERGVRQQGEGRIA